MVIAHPSCNYSLAYTAPQARTLKPSSSMPHTSCLGRPSPGALTMWASVGQTFQSQSVSVWTARVRFGHTPPGTPSRTGLWTSLPSAVVSPSLGPHSRHGQRLEQVLLDA